MVPAQADAPGGIEYAGGGRAASCPYHSLAATYSGSGSRVGWLPAHRPTGGRWSRAGHLFEPDCQHFSASMKERITMTKPFQMFLLAFAVLALLTVGADLTYSIVATTHGRTPARVVRVQAGPYPLMVSLYNDPARAGYAMPFAVAPAQPVDGTLSYQVTSVPSHGDVSATAVRATISPDA